MNFLLPLINILDLGKLILAVLLMIPLVLDALVYSLVAYSFKIFQLMCTVNFNSIYGIIQPLVDRLQAVIIVFVVYLLGSMLIKSMLEPTKAGESGKKFLKNLFIATALFVSYNFIFTVANELNIVLMGNSTGYKYTALSEIVDLTDADVDKKGVIMRSIFGPDETDDPGSSIAASLLGGFIRDHDSPSHTALNAQIRDSGSYSTGGVRFWNIISLDFAKRISGDGGKEIDYTFFVSTAVGAFVVYSMFKASLQVGIRMFKLLLLQMIAPIVIVDVIKNGFEGKFKKWAATYGKVFLDVIIRMFSILIVSVFVSKFLVHINDYFPSLSSEEGFFTSLIIKVIIVIAAYLFVGEVPNLINEALGGKLEVKGNPLGGLLGAGAGAVAGAIGGAAGGGLGGAIAGFGKGAISGGKAGSKGNNIADLFKAGTGAHSGAKALGQTIRSQGGLGRYIAGGVAGAVGVGSMYERRLNELDRQSNALDEVDAAEKAAIKDMKLGKNNENDALYSEGYEDVKYGEDKDAYAAKMLQFDNEYQTAMSHYDYIQSDDPSVSAAAYELDQMTKDFENYGDDFKQYEAECRDINNKTLAELNDPNINTEEDLAKWKSEQIAQREFAHKDSVEKHDRLEAARAAREKEITDARIAAQTAKVHAENRAKTNYDNAKANSGNVAYDPKLAENVRAKRSAYRGTLHGAERKDVGGAGGDPINIKDQKNRIYRERANIKNKDLYRNTKK